jgi:hypothetical protein
VPLVGDEAAGADDADDNIAGENIADESNTTDNNSDGTDDNADGEHGDDSEGDAGGALSALQLLQSISAPVTSMRQRQQLWRRPHLALMQGPSPEDRDRVDKDYEKKAEDRREIDEKVETKERSQDVQHRRVVFGAARTFKNNTSTAPVVNVAATPADALVPLPARVAKSQSRFLFTPAHPKEYSKLMDTKYSGSGSGSSTTGGHQQRNQHPDLASGNDINTAAQTIMTSTRFMPLPPEGGDDRMQKLVKMQTDKQKVLADSLGMGVETERRTLGGGDAAFFKEKLALLMEKNTALQASLTQCQSELESKNDMIAKMEEDALKLEEHYTKRREAEVQAARREFAREHHHHHHQQQQQQPPQQQEEERGDAKSIEELLSGSIFIKHGRSGKPHARLVWVSEDLRYVCWRHPGAKRERSFPVRDIVSVVSGKKTAVFQRQHNWQDKTHNTFSIITTDPERTLDLEVDFGSAIATTRRQQRRERNARDAWVEKFALLVQLRNMPGMGKPPPPSNRR